MVTNDKIIKKVVKRNQQNYVPLLFDMKKANPVEVNSQNIYDGLIAAFKYGKIGIYSNSCAKIWNKEVIDKDGLKSLKLLVAESNWSIDAAKCLYMASRPESANKLITSQTKGKLPAFFKYAKDKTDSQLENPTNSTMNRIMNRIPDARIRYSKTIGKLDWRVLINQNEDYTVLENSFVIKAYNYWIKHQFRFGYGEDEHVNEDDLYKYRRIREEILKTNQSLNYIVNSLVAYAYSVKKDSNKKLLWACFGNEIVQNIKINASGCICPICGKRFEPNVHNKLCCCNKCAHALDTKKKREKREKINNGEADFA